MRASIADLKFFYKVNNGVHLTSLHRFIKEKVGQARKSPSEIPSNFTQCRMLGARFAISLSEMCETAAIKLFSKALSPTHILQR